MKVRRKIVALGTALAMAFVMVASLVMVTDVKAVPAYINNVKVTLSQPTVGDKVNGVENVIKVTPESGAPYTVKATYLQKTNDADTGAFQPSEFPYSFESGTDYYCRFFLHATDRSSQMFPINESTQRPLDGQLNFEVSGAEFDSYNYCTDEELQVTVKFKAKAGGSGTDPSGGDDPSGGEQPSGGDADQGGNSEQTPAASTTTSTVTTLTDGESATLNPSADGTVSFRIEKDFKYFQNGGKLYIDGQEVPTDQYYATTGSTIITLVKEYAAKLADGLEHAVKVVFNNNEEFNATIKVAAASSDGTAATTANTDTATVAAATTTKVKSPKTADVLPFVGIAVVFVGASAVAFVLYRRKNS